MRRKIPLGQYGDFTLYEGRSPGWFVLNWKPYAHNGIDPNPKSHFRVHWSDKWGRVTRNRDMCILGKYHPDVHAWLNATLAGFHLVEQIVGVLGPAFARPAKNGFEKTCGANPR
jgi:hypothetical protein